MFSDTDLQLALDSHLKSLNNLPAVAWDNVGFEQTDELFLTVNMITAEGQTVGIEIGGSDVDAGIYQITICGQKGKGRKPITEMYDKLRQHFYRGLRLTKNKTAVVVHKVFVSPPISDESQYRVPVSIRYRAYVLR